MRPKTDSLKLKQPYNGLHVFAKVALNSRVTLTQSPSCRSHPNVKGQFWINSSE
jgi:hypothetical protein